MSKKISKEDADLLLNWLEKHSGARPFGEGKSNKPRDYSNHYNVNSYKANSFYSCHDLICVGVHRELFPLFKKAVKNDSHSDRYGHEGLSLHFPEENEILSPIYFKICKLVEKYFILGYTLSAVYDEMHHVRDYSGFYEKSMRFADFGPLWSALWTLDIKMGIDSTRDYMVRIGECITMTELINDSMMIACRLACSRVYGKKAINGMSIEDLVEMTRKEEKTIARRQKNEKHYFSSRCKNEIIGLLTEEEAQEEERKRDEERRKFLRKTLPALQKLIRKMLIEISNEIRSCC